jgi:hypothetical protein
MWDLKTINARNQQIGDAYLASTPHRQRLADRLDALSITSPEQNALILAAFDAAPAEFQARLAEMDLPGLLVAVEQAR